MLSPDLLCKKKEIISEFYALANAQTGRHQLSHKLLSNFHKVTAENANGAIIYFQLFLQSSSSIFPSQISTPTATRSSKSQFLIVAKCS